MDNRILFKNNSYRLKYFITSMLYTYSVNCFQLEIKLTFPDIFNITVIVITILITNVF